jgi:hypothetical protein
MPRSASFQYFFKLPLYPVCSNGDTQPLKPALAQFPFFVLPRLR